MHHLSILHLNFCTFLSLGDTIFQDLFYRRYNKFSAAKKLLIIKCQDEITLPSGLETLRTDQSAVIVSMQNSPYQPIRGQNVPSQPIRGQNAPSQPIRGQNTPSQPTRGQNAAPQPIKQQPPNMGSERITGRKSGRWSGRSYRENTRALSFTNQRRFSSGRPGGSPLDNRPRYDITLEQARYGSAGPRQITPGYRPPVQPRVIERKEYVLDNIQQLDMLASRAFYSGE